MKTSFLFLLLSTTSQTLGRGTHKDYFLTFPAIDFFILLVLHYQDRPMTVLFLAFDFFIVVSFYYQDRPMTVTFLAFDFFIVVSFLLSRSSNDCAFPGT